MKNLQVLAKEIFSIYRICPPNVGQLLSLSNNNASLQQFSQLNLPNLKSVSCRTKSISFLAPKIWNDVSNEFKKETSLDAFKKVKKK